MRRIFGIFYSENTKNDSAARRCLFDKMKPFYQKIVLKRNADRRKDHE